MSFAVQKADFYDGNFPSFRKPTEIGCFSLEGDREYHNDARQLKYISLPNRLRGIHMDLNVGYNDAIKKEFGKKERIDSLLKWILNNLDKVNRNFCDPVSKKLNIDFICFRGLLTKICATVYENKEDWIICATKFNSVIYLCQFETDADIRRRERATERDKLMSSWGYKFEQYLSADSPNGAPDLSKPVNEKEEFNIVLKGRLQSHTLLFSAETDVKDPRVDGREDPLQTYIELKTSRIIETERQDINFCRYKVLKWWLQSFLVGTPKIICGFRNDSGIVRNLQPFRVSELPKMGKGVWSPAATLNFCVAFLDFVKSCVKKDDPRIVYKFYWKPGSTVTCQEMEDPGEYRVLPDWYIRDLKL